MEDKSVYGVTGDQRTAYQIVVELEARGALGQSTEGYEGDAILMT